MPPQLPRFEAALQRIEDDRKLARILLESDTRADCGVAGATAGGDPDRLRGIPAVGRGCSGAIPGTNPLGAAIAKDMRRSRNGVRRPR